MISIMANQRQADPRANQKARTRAAIVAAAQQLQRGGTPPTIAQAAQRAGVSRATAHRYFPTQETLLVEVTDITPAVASVETLFNGLTTKDPEQRLLLLLDAVNPIVLEQEAHMRRAMRVYLDTWLRNRPAEGDSPPSVREGRRMRWLEDALAPLADMPQQRRRRLQTALALTLGIDSIVVLKDVCRLNDDETLAVLRWAATALLRAGLQDDSTGAAAS